MPSPSPSPSTPLTPRTPRTPRRRVESLPIALSREEHWTLEQYVDDVHIRFLYSPHTITALLVALGAVCFFGLFRDSSISSPLDNYRLGAGVAVFVFVVLGMIVFPAGPFIRPHPVVWRITFAIGVVYELFLIVLLMQTPGGARESLRFFDSDLGQDPGVRSYASDCTFSWSVISANVFDRFFVSHLIGWMLKSLLIRDYMICWAVSIQWELIEIMFTHMLPNFAECWWDQWLLDVCLANAIGIYLGHRLCEWLEVKEYNWSDFNTLPSFRTKAKRALMQFTPERWSKIRLAPFSSLKRYFQIHFLILALHLAELNAFFLKTVLWIPIEHPINIIRLGLWLAIGVAGMRQANVYITDPNCKRFGTQAWLAIALLFTELMCIIKFGRGKFLNPMPDHIKTGAAVFVCLYIVASAILFVRGRSDHHNKNDRILKNTTKNKTL
jgi:phosphatidylserine synthase 2